LLGLNNSNPLYRAVSEYDLKRFRLATPDSVLLKMNAVQRSIVLATKFLLAIGKKNVL
jgi:hypothetical protein